MEIKTGYIEALRRGKKSQIKTILLLPFPLSVIVALGISILSNGNSMFYLMMFLIFISYYVFAFKAFKHIYNMMFMLFLFFLSTSLLLLASCVYIILMYVPLNTPYVNRLNILYPWNLIIVTSLILTYAIYFIRKFSEIDVSYLKSFLKKEKKYDLVNKTYSMDKTRGNISCVYKKRIEDNLQRKFSFLGCIRDKILSWILLIAFYFVPVSPYVLRGVGHGKPLSYILLVIGLFFTWIFGMGAQRFYAYFRVCNQVEKEIGEPLKPILE